VNYAPDTSVQRFYAKFTFLTEFSQSTHHNYTIICSFPPSTKTNRNVIAVAAPTDSKPSESATRRGVLPHRIQVGKVNPWHTKTSTTYIITRRRSINAALQKQNKTYMYVRYILQKKKLKNSRKHSSIILRVCYGIRPSRVLPLFGKYCRRLVHL
jgi:hypothetical protein